MDPEKAATLGPDARGILEMFEAIWTEIHLAARACDRARYDRAMRRFLDERRKFRDKVPNYDEAVDLFQLGILDQETYGDLTKVDSALEVFNIEVWKGARLFPKFPKQCASETTGPCECCGEKPPACRCCSDRPTVKPLLVPEKRSALGPQALAILEKFEPIWEEIHRAIAACDRKAYELAVEGWNREYAEFQRVSRASASALRGLGEQGQEALIDAKGKADFTEVWNALFVAVNTIPKYPENCEPAPKEPCDCCGEGKK